MKRSITLVCVLTVLTLCSSGTSWAFGKNKIVYDDFDWKIYSSTHFDIYFYEEERDSLQKVVNLAESAYDEISRKFEFQITKRIPLIYYQTHSAFEQTNVILMFIPEGIGAFAEPVKNRMVLPIDLPDEKLYALIKHELTHIFEYEIIFQGSIRREFRASPPTWLMEGLASFMAEDEDTTDLMVLRDAVVNDNLPSIAQGFGGFFAYRFGHAVFRFMVQKWGMQGLRDFIYEYRNSLGGSMERPLRRSFDLSVEEFDTQFRTWLRKQYLPALIAKGEPTEYGKPFRVREGIRSLEMSPSPAPSGDLLAAVTTYKEDVDIALFNVPERKLFRNISKGYPDEYEYIIGQFLTTAPVMGRDVAFAPDGDRIAFFVKKERGRYLIVVNALSGDIEVSERMDVEQQLSPAFSPDGRKIAFHGFRGNQADIFVFDLDTKEVMNLTEDSFFDAAPVYSPDGRWLYYSSVVEGYAKIFRLDLSDPSRRFQLTRGDWNDRDAWTGASGDRIFFASDRPTGRTQEVVAAAGLLESAESRAKDETKTPPADVENFAAFNIYSLDLTSGEIVQYTDVIGGAFTPVVFIGDEGKETVVFSSYYKGNWSLYSTPTAENLGVAETVDLPVAPLLHDDRFEFLPPVEVALDPASVKEGGKFKLFIEDISVNGGVTSDQTLVSRSVIQMSDMLGNRRFIAALDSVSTFSNFDFLYLDLSRRWTWGARVFDDRTFYIDPDSLNDSRIERRRLYRQTGGLGLLSYPFDRYHRIDFGAGYMYRDFDIPIGQAEPGEPIPTLSFTDDFPFVFSAFNGDSSVFKSFGPVSGRRYYVNTQYLYDLDEGGALSADVQMDFRQYYQLTSRSLLAARVFGGYSEGNRPNFYYFGGLNTLRGYDFRSIVGNRAFYGNFEYRFPLIDLIASPYLTIREVRGALFFDVGGAWFDDQDFELWRDGKLGDALASVGWGISFRFMGLELHWDFARRTDLDEIDDETETSFWIGQTF